MFKIKTEFSVGTYHEVYYSVSHKIENGETIFKIIANMQGETTKIMDGLTEAQAKEAILKIADTLTKDVSYVLIDADSLKSYLTENVK